MPRRLGGAVKSKLTAKPSDGFVYELTSQGIMTYCLTLDPDADSYVKRIFGMNNDAIIDNLQKLPVLFATITK